MPDQPGQHQPHTRDVCGWCLLPVIEKDGAPGVYVHMTAGHEAACLIARALLRFAAEGWFW